MSQWPSLVRVAQRASIAALGQTAQLVSGEQAAEVRGIYVPTPSEVESGGAYLRTVAPALHVEAARLPEWAGRGTEVDLGGTLYVVTDLVPDGEGITELQLRCL